MTSTETIVEMMLRTKKPKILGRKEIAKLTRIPTLHVTCFYVLAQGWLLPGLESEESGGEENHPGHDSAAKGDVLVDADKEQGTCLKDNLGDAENHLEPCQWSDSVGGEFLVQAVGGGWQWQWHGDDDEKEDVDVVVEVEEVKSTVASYCTYLLLITLNLI